MALLPETIPFLAELMEGKFSSPNEITKIKLYDPHRFIKFLNENPRIIVELCKNDLADT
jgi:hypothetical protein